MKILIAEDNAFSRTLLKKTLAKAGYEAVVAENGEADYPAIAQNALQALRGEEGPTDLALRLDYAVKQMFKGLK